MSKPAVMASDEEHTDLLLAVMSMFEPRRTTQFSLGHAFQQVKIPESGHKVSG